MKKLLLLAVLVVMVATPVFAKTIKNSKHNLSLSSAYSVRSTTYDEICVFCHTPHAARTISNAPLWNRLDSGTAITKFYNSATLNSANLTSDNDLIGSDANLCISCHDGTTLADGIYNPPNKLAAQPTMVAAPDNAVGATANLLDGSNGLSNDHPIAFTYDAALALADNELVSPATSTHVVAGGPVQLWSSKMWCSSCHDVHDDQYSPFLVTSNSASKLCLTCHVK
ncbi:MAG: cytochrome c3 family protein [Desulfuromonadales bacterium]